MKKLRGKLLAAMAAVILVTLGASAVFMRNVTHEEIRRRLVARPRASGAIARTLADAYGSRGRWNDVPLPARTVVTDTAYRVLAKSPDLRDATVTAGQNQIAIERTHDGMLLRFPPEPLPGIGFVYFLPDNPRPAPEFAAFDRRIVAIYAIAAAAAIAITMLLSRHITRPIESLTVAADAMARGAAPAPVAVQGHDEIARLARSFNSMTAAVAAQEQLRRRMVSDIAHELRTPLTNLRCELEAVQDGLTQPDVASLHEEVVHLSALVDDLQDLAIAESGALKLWIERVDLTDVVRRVVDVVSAEAERRHVAITIDASQSFVAADTRRMQQVIRNLLTNALQHTTDGGTIQITARDCSVSIEDSGPGIPPEHLDRIFERFYRVSESRARSNGGAGLGLAIVRQLVELHRGTVRAENTARGAKFTVTLPSS